MRIGVDIGGTNLVAGLVDNNYNLICKEQTLLQVLLTTIIT